MKISPKDWLFLTLVGLALVNILNNSNALVQAMVPDDLRGRVMGLYSLMFTGGGPLGSLMVGLMADRLNESIPALFCAAVLLVFAVSIFFFRPDVRRIK